MLPSERLSVVLPLNNAASSILITPVTWLKLIGELPVIAALISASVTAPNETIKFVSLVETATTVFATIILLTVVLLSA